MASPEAKPKLLTFSVKFNSLQGVFEFPGSIKVDQALHKIAERFKEPEDALSVLHRGIAVPGDAPLEVALGAASAVTVIHVVRKSPDHKGPTTAQLLLLQNNKVSDDLHAFCSVCKSRVVARPVFICKKCSGKKGYFTRHSSEEVNFHGEVSPDHLLGSCTCSAGGETPGEGKGEKLSHCLECKQVWHEGKCITVDATEGNSVAESYPINPPDAEKACWPQAQQ